MIRRLFVVLAFVSCAQESARVRTAAPPQAAAPARTPAQVVEELGRRMKQVSTLAPPESAAKSIREAYSGLVDADLLARWEANPATAPGRQVSSPWPERIEWRT